MDKYVRRFQADYAQALASLTPKGAAWPEDPDSAQQRVLYGVAGIWGNEVSGEADLLLTVESFPPTSIALLPDWEHSFGLPDPCVQEEPHTIADRKNALVRRMTLQGGQSREFFINEALELGYTIWITEYSPFVCGLSQCGPSNGVFNQMRGGDPSDFAWNLGPAEQRFYWTVHINNLRISYFIAGSGRCGERLGTIATALDLECTLNRYKPAHTTIIFDYSTNYELDFSQPFNSGYLALLV